MRRRPPGSAGPTVLRCLPAFTPPFALACALAVAPARAGDVHGFVALPERSESNGVSVDLYSKYARPAETGGPTGPRAAIGFQPLDGSPVPPPSGPAPIMDQRGARFVPRIVPVQAGGRVEFLNSDPLFHNVFSLSPTRKFDLGRYPRGDSRFVTFERPGVVQVFCDIHAEMHGFVVVFETPYYTAPERDGRFRMEGLPPGAYEVLGWMEGRNQFETLGRVQVPATGAVEFRGEFPGGR